MSLVADDHLGNGVYHIDAHYVKPGVASLYCVVHHQQVAIIETGTAHSLPYVRNLLTQLGLSAQQVRYVVPTHVHLDHAGGAGVMMREFPQAELIIHPRGARHMIDPAKLVTATRGIYGDKAFDDLYGEIPPIDASRVIAAEHGFSFKLDDREFTIIDTPGHAYHHFCVVDPASKGVFTGDTFGLSYPNLRYQGNRFIMPTTTPSHFDPAALHKSIDLIMSYQPQRMYLTHFNMLPDPSALVDHYHTMVDRYVELTLSVKPDSEEALSRLMQAMGELLMDEFDLEQDTISNQLAMDIKLNCQGLAHWYQHRER
jgi:glyoxylase-like metal-dependent hydrolase (beta-lactamase superfamily II)